MNFTIDKKCSGKYIYQKIYDQFKQAIMNGELQADEKLPSKRKLSNQLQVGVNTVTNAYEQLLTEGYIYTKERKGYFVENIQQFTKHAMKEQSLPADLKEKEEEEQDWLSLSHMTADVSLFPFSKWNKCEHIAIKNHQQDLAKVVHPQGPFLVRKTIARMIAVSRGVTCEPEQVVIGAGTQLLIQQLMEMQPMKTKVAVENPGYSRFYTLLQRKRMNVEKVDLDENGVQVAELSGKDVQFLFVTPSHQFPTGKIMPISRRIELLNWSTQGPGRYIIEDDYDSEFKYETDSIPSLQSLDRNKRVIYTGTFSKTLLPGMRISYMVLPPEMLREYQAFHHDQMQTGNILALYTLHYFIESGEYARHLRRMNLHYEKKRKLLMTGIQDRFGDKVTIEDIPAGLHFLARFTTPTTYEKVEQRAREQKLELYTMKRFMLNGASQPDNTIDLVLGFATIAEDKIEEAIERLYKVLNE